MRTYSFLERTVAVVLLFALTACTSATTINSRPQGAMVYLNGATVGRTPYVMQDTRIVGSSTHVRLVYPGYEDVNAVITRNEDFNIGACIGGVFFLVPYLWLFGYEPEHNYEMQPAQGGVFVVQQEGVPQGYGPPPGYVPPPPPPPGPVYGPPTQGGPPQQGGPPPVYPQ